MRVGTADPCAGGGRWPDPAGPCRSPAPVDRAAHARCGCVDQRASFRPATRRPGSGRSSRRSSELRVSPRCSSSTTSRPTARRDWPPAPGRPSSSVARCRLDGSARRGPCSRVWTRQPETGSSRSTPTRDRSPRCRRPWWRAARTSGLDLATVAGHFECPSAPLRWLHPALLTTLLVRASPSGGPVHRLIGNGQCMAFRRTTLVAAGGFGPVGHHTVEDVALVRSMATAGFAVGFLDASSLLSVRMFESAREAWRGWGRSLSLPGVDPWWRRTGDRRHAWWSSRSCRSCGSSPAAPTASTQCCSPHVSAR